MDSGGGISHFSSLVIAEYAATGEYANNVESLRMAYRLRRDALLSSLAEHLEGRATWQVPRGGYFVWLSVTTSVAELMKAAADEGVGFMPGSAFSLSPPPSPSIRLSFSRYSPSALSEAGRRLGNAFRRL
jgi:2-aminoadipate transaminase